MYAFEGLITSLCRRERVPKDSVDYMEPLFTTPLDIKKTKGPKNMYDPSHNSRVHMRDKYKYNAHVWIGNVAPHKWVSSFH